MNKTLKDIFFSLSITSFIILISTASLDIFLATYYRLKSRDIRFKEYYLKYPSIQKIYKESGFNKEDTKKLLRETYEFNKGSWIYETFTGFRERPREEVFVNISQGGFRRNYKHSTKLNHLSTINKKDNNKKIIYFFGGSTTFGYGVSDNQTIPAYLEKNLNETAVFNFGRAYYYSETENILIERLLKFGAVKPDIAIFLDGINERGDIKAYQDQMNQLFSTASKERPEKGTLGLAKPYFWILEKLKTKLAKKARVSIYTSTNNFKLYDLPKISLESVFESNLQTRKAICSKYNIKCITFIQPIPGNHSINSIIDNERKDILKKQITLLKTVDSEFIDLSKSLSDFKKQAYVDLIHYSPQANKIIADKISSYLID